MGRNRDTTNHTMATHETYDPRSSQILLASSDDHRYIHGANVLHHGATRGPFRITYRPATHLNIHEVTATSTYDYKNLRPTIGGLFCEVIFGRLRVKMKRRRQAGHIKLPSPTMQTWFLKNQSHYAAYLTNRQRRVVEDLVYGHACVHHHRAPFATSESESSEMLRLRKAWTAHGDLRRHGLPDPSPDVDVADLQPHQVARLVVPRSGHRRLRSPKTCHVTWHRPDPDRGDPYRRVITGKTVVVRTGHRPYARSHPWSSVGGVLVDHAYDRSQQSLQAQIWHRLPDARDHRRPSSVAREVKPIAYDPFLRVIGTTTAPDAFADVSRGVAYAKVTVGSRPLLLPSGHDAPRTRRAGDALVVDQRVGESHPAPTGSGAPSRTAAYERVDGTSIDVGLGGREPSPLSNGTHPRHIRWSRNHRHWAGLVARLRRVETAVWTETITTLPYAKRLRWSRGPGRGSDHRFRFERHDGVRQGLAATDRDGESWWWGSIGIDEHLRRGGRRLRPYVGCDRRGPTKRGRDRGVHRVATVRHRGAVAYGTTGVGRAWRVVTKRDDTGHEPQARRRYITAVHPVLDAYRRGCADSQSRRKAPFRGTEGRRAPYLGPDGRKPLLVQALAERIDRVYSNKWHPQNRGFTKPVRMDMYARRRRYRAKLTTAQRDEARDDRFIRCIGDLWWSSRVRESSDGAGSDVTPPTPRRTPIHTLSSPRHDHQRRDVTTALAVGSRRTATAMVKHRDRGGDTSPSQKSEAFRRRFGLTIHG